MQVADVTLGLLVLARVLPLCVALAVLTRALVPLPVVLSLALSLAAALAPLAGGRPLDLEARALAFALLRELGIGSTFALALGLALLGSGWAIGMAGTGPARESVRAPLRTAYLLASGWLVLSLGGLRAVVIGLAASFEDAALAGPRHDAPALLLGLVQIFVDALATAFGFALPWIASAWLLDVTLGLVARALGAQAHAPVSLVRQLGFGLAGALLLVPVATRAPDAVRAAITAARALTRAFAR